MALSAPQRLTISVPYCCTSIADILASHTTRLSFLKVGPTLYDVASVAQVLEQDMPLLTHLAILHQWRPRDVSTFTLNLPSYPKLRTLEFEGAHFYTPSAPWTSLRHLKLKHCTIQPPPPESTVHPLCAVHNALRLFPNLETLSLVHSLSEEDRNGTWWHSRLPELMETVHLPCLRLLELEDIPAGISLFLSHLIFPLTTVLVLEPACMFPWYRRPLASPLFPGINPSPSDPSAPNTELSLCIYRPRASDAVARWETRGDGVRPVRITLPRSAYLRAKDTIPLIVCFTSEIVATLLPAPAPAPATPPGVTSLTVQRSTYLHPCVWEELLRELPALRRLECISGGAEDDLIDILGKRSEPPGASEGPGFMFLCTRLAELELGWRIPYGTELGQDRGEREPLQPDDDSGRVEGSESRLAALLSKSLCDALGRCLTARAEHCEPIRKLSVSLPRKHYSPYPGVLEEGQVAWVEQRLRHALGHLVLEIVVTAEAS